MKREFSDELISAFLDGELTADEQALVEQQLLDSPEHRKMFAELRALRESLQSLPTHQLDGQFHERVIKQAERTMLADGSETPRSDSQAPRQTVADNKAESATKAAASVAGPASATMWRRAFWVAAAVAASLLVAVIWLPRRPQLLPVAQHSQDTDRPTQKGDETADKDDAFDAKNVNELPATGQSNQVVAGDGAVRTFGNAGAVAGDADREHRGRSLQPENGGIGGGFAGAKAMQTPAASRQSNHGTSANGAVPTPNPALADKPDTNRMPLRQRAGLELAEMAQGGAGGYVQNGSALYKARWSRVVEVGIPKSAYDKHLVNRLLAKNNIRLQQPHQDRTAAANEPPPAELRRSRSVAPLNEPLLDEAPLDAGHGLDVVVVDASLAQVNALLDDLQARGNVSYSESLENNTNRAAATPPATSPARALDLVEDAPQRESQSLKDSAAGKQKNLGTRDGAPAERKQAGATASLAAPGKKKELPRQPTAGLNQRREKDAADDAAEKSAAPRSATAGRKPETDSKSGSDGENKRNRNLGNKAGLEELRDQLEMRTELKTAETFKADYGVAVRIAVPQKVKSMLSAQRVPQAAFAATEAAQPAAAAPFDASEAAKNPRLAKPPTDKKYRSNAKLLRKHDGDATPAVVEENAVAETELARRMPRTAGGLQQRVQIVLVINLLPDVTSPVANERATGVVPAEKARSVPKPADK